MGFQERLAQHEGELRELYLGLYHDEGAYGYFTDMLRRSYAERKSALRRLDSKRLKEPDWYRSNGLMGMMMYPAAFAGSLNGVREKIDYLKECGVNYLHLMPLLDSPKGRSDGGYAVSDFRKVRPDLGTMEDLEALADELHKNGIALCLDFVLNHTSEDHEWAKAARAGDPVARSRYFFYDSWDIPSQFERTVPQVFPTTAPGNYTYLPDCNQIVMTTFYPFQWDLNYANPMVLNDMTDNLLYLANRGMDVVRLDAVPYIWKQLGTNCRNLPQVHALTRIMRLACQIVCPSVLMLGEVVMEPREVAPYFGTPEKPECDMLYNVTTMCTTWHTLATRDVRLLRRQADIVSELPENCVFQNYLRCHDDIGWGLDYPWLRRFNFDEVAHKRFLNDWFTGRFPGSWSKGELYNDDPRLGDARLCGTTASLTGVESAVESGDERSLDRALQCFMMLHAWMFSQSGIPVLYSGDEVGQCNDWNYHNDPDKAEDSRWIHRGDFGWESAARRTEKGTVQELVFDGLRALEKIRAAHPAFRADAHVSTFDTGSDEVLGLRRAYGSEELIALFNFSERPQELWLDVKGSKDLLSGETAEENLVLLRSYDFLWLLRSV
ncbi:MAG: alpha-amylase family protein [Oscillospiraceae bacterium]|nr:alpha-amylase family protein [Oscillospiraceae bacterium]